MKIQFSNYSFYKVQTSQSNNSKANCSLSWYSFLGKYQSSKRFNDMPKDIYEPNKKRYKYHSYASKVGKEYDKSCEKAKIALIDFVSRDCNMDVKYQTKTIKKMREMLDFKRNQAFFLLFFQLLNSQN